MDEKRPAWTTALALALLAVAGPTFIRLASQGLWWDEAVYLGLARALAAGHYTLEPGAAVESFRPPLFPFLLFLLGGHEAAARIFAGLGTAAALVLTARIPGGTRDGKLPTTLIFALCVPGFILCGCKILSESIFVMLSAAAFLCMRRAEVQGGLRWWALTGWLLGLTLLTRYFGLLTIGCALLALLIALLAQRKGGWALLATLAGLALPLALFALISLRTYGTPLGFLGEYRGMYKAARLDGLGRGLWHIGMTLSVLPPFMAWGLVLLVKTWRRARPSDLLLGLIATSSILLYLLASHKEPRYMVSFVWAYAALAASGFPALHERLGRAGRWLRPGLAGVAALGVAVAFAATAQDANVGRPVMDGARYLKTVTAPGNRIFSTSAPYVYYGAERTPAFEPRPDAIIAFMLKQGITYVLLDKLEASNPPSLNAFFDQHPEAFERLRAFPGRDTPEAAVVYRLRPDATD